MRHARTKLHHWREDGWMSGGGAVSEGVPTAKGRGKQLEGEDGN